VNFEEVVLKVVEILNRINIPYFLTGALAVVYYGEPRTTQDIDIVVEIQDKDIITLIKNFRSDFIISEESIKVAIRDRTMFNVLHKDMNFKIDFWVLGDDEFSRERILKRSKKNILGTEMYLPNAEDVIISKLEWFKMSNLDKHYFDAFGVYRIQKGNLDLEYINQWCKKKSVLKIWEKLRKEK
jgi:hypothetical protein